ncbi:kinetochore protein Spc24 [Sorex araneus]|uniref:kinetochore protein Spc24 n=1 Tax=Sorex araneus TaxID=42254 RepID=UPI002433D7D2|nr:kinetochore protein Spc24 [Sorex araneus]
MAAFRDMEDVSQGLMSLLAANRAEAQQRQLLERQEKVVERLMRAQDKAERRLQEITAAEEEVAKKLLQAQAQVQAGREELQRLQEEIQKVEEEDTSVQALLTQMLHDLNEIKDEEADLDKSEKKVDEDSTVTIPSAVYVAQLYNRISKIEWDYETEKEVIRGIHHGPSVAQPINLDASQHSKKFVSDFLWSLLDTQW